MQSLLAKLAHYALAGLGVVLAGWATHITQGDLWTVGTLLHWAAGAIVVWLSSLVVSSTLPKSTTGASRLLVLLGLLVVSPVLLACPPAAEAAPVVTVMATGDSAHVYVSWGAVNRATSYQVTVSAIATNGTWTNLPVNAPVAGTSTVALGISSNADSAVFQACVKSVNASATSAAGCSAVTPSAKNTWHRTLQPPLVNTDSVTALRFFPRDTTGVVFGAHVTFCAFVQFLTPTPGTTVWAMHTADAPVCTGEYHAHFTGAERLVAQDQQVVADNFCVTWKLSSAKAGTIAPTACVTSGSLTLPGTGGPAVRIAADVTAVREAVQGV